MNDFLIGLWSATKSGFYMTAGGDQLNGWTEKLQSTSQSQKMVPVTGGPLPVWSTTVFWIPAKPLHPRSMLSKWMICTENSNVCSQHWPTERAQFFSMTVPNCTTPRLHNPHFKSWTNWAMEFCLIHLIHLTSHLLTTTSSRISWQLFAGKTLP